MSPTHSQCIFCHLQLVALQEGPAFSGWSMTRIIWALIIFLHTTNLVWVVLVPLRAIISAVVEMRGWIKEEFLLIPCDSLFLFLFILNFLNLCTFLVFFHPNLIIRIYWNILISGAPPSWPTNLSLCAFLGFSLFFPLTGLLMRASRGNV